ncbi:MAG: MFS transporter [Thermoplasmata archaeon]
MAPPSAPLSHRLLARPWLLVFVPVNAATSAFGIALPLLILITLHGSWVQVALAATLFNAAVIVASMLWGYLSDRFPRRRRFLAFNYLGYAVVFAALSQFHSLTVLLLLYMAVGLLAPAGTSASNLLILEQFSERERGTAYASFQEMSILGSMAGLLVGYAWLVVHFPLPPMLLVLAVLSVVSVVAVQIGVRDSPRHARTINVAHHPESLSSRLRHSVSLRVQVPFFPKRPSLKPGSLARFRKWVRQEVRHEIPLIFAATLLFNLSANLFNISYTPYLYSAGIGAAAIFLVSFSNNTAQALAYPASGRITDQSGSDLLVQRSTYLRGLGYLAVAGFTFVPVFVGLVAFSANLVAYGIMGGAIAFYSTASSLILFRALEGRDAGTLLGVNSALGGVAAVGGAALSGLLALVGSFRLSFLLSAAALLASLPLWTAAHVAHVRRKAGVVGPTPSASSDRPAISVEARRRETD